MREDGVKQVKDFMTINVLCFKPDDKIEDVVKKMTKKKISGAPIVNDDKQVVGIICSSDLATLMSADMPRVGPTMPSTLGLMYALYKTKKQWDKIKKRLKLNVYASKVNEVMVPGVITTPPDASIYEVATLMKLKRVNRLPVVDENNKLVGIIARQDVIRAMIN